MGYQPTVALPSELNTLTGAGGHFVLPRSFSQQWQNLVSGTLRLGYFTAQRAVQATKFQIDTGGTAAGATPTLVRCGLYLEASNGDLSLVASSVNNTALMGAVWTTYSPPLSTPYTPIVGSRYALGLLVVSAAAMPNMFGVTNLNYALSAVSPIIGAVHGGGVLTDLPGSIATGSITAAAPHQMGLLP